MKQITPQKPVVDWNDPKSIPEVELGSQELFWLAVETMHGVHVFDAYFVNRPIVVNEDGEITRECEDWLLSDPDGREIVGAVGWHSCKEHSEFDNFYVPLHFRNRYVLLGWAEYETPEFTGV